MKTRIFALAVALAMPAAATHAATFTLPAFSPVDIVGPISGVQMISLSFVVDASVQDPTINLAGWDGFVLGRTDLSSQAFDVGRCLYQPSQ